MIFVKISQDFNKSPLKFASSHRFSPQLMACMHIVKLLRYHIYSNKRSLSNKCPPTIFMRKRLPNCHTNWLQNIEIFIYLPTFCLENVILGLLNCSANGRLLEYITVHLIIVGVRNLRIFMKSLINGEWKILILLDQ